MDLRKQIYNVCLGRKKLKWEHSLPYVELFGLGLISGAIWEKALLTWYINNSVSSYFILTIGPTALIIIQTYFMTEMSHFRI